MIQLLFGFYDKNRNDGKAIISHTFSTQENVIIFSDALMDSIFAQYPGLKEKTENWKINISCEMATVIIDKYSYTQEFQLFDFNNTKSSIALLKARDTNLHLVGIDIVHIQTENCRLLLSESSCDSLYCGIGAFIESVQNPKLKLVKKNIDLRRSNIKRAHFYHDSDNLFITECNINEIRFFDKKNPINISEFVIFNSSIQDMNINCCAQRFKIKDSLISKMTFISSTLLYNIEISMSEIVKVYGCNENSFINKSNDTWSLVKKANYKINTEQYCKAGYQIIFNENKDRISKEKNIAKRFGYIVSDYFLRWSTGYAYKPKNALSFTLMSIVGFAFLYSLFDFIFWITTGNCNFDTISFVSIINALLKRLYLSGITFATIGFGDITPSNWLTQVISIIEGCLGVTILSLFVISLAKKYLD